MEGHWLPWKVLGSIEVCGCYEKSTDAMTSQFGIKITACYEKQEVAFESQLLQYLSLKKANGTWKSMFAMENYWLQRKHFGSYRSQWLPWKVNGCNISHWLL
jgi:hypothetical protein